MPTFRMFFLIYTPVFLLFKAEGSVNISEVINNTEKIVQIVYAYHLGEVHIVNSKSIITGERESDKVTYEGQYKNIVSISFPPKTITSLKGVYIPEFAGGSSKGELGIGFGTLVKPFNPDGGPGGGQGVFTIIYKNKNNVEVISVVKGRKNYEKTKSLLTNVVPNNDYILEIDSDNSLKLYLRTAEKVFSYFNPAKLEPQALLHQAIVNDSIEDIEAAVKLGANIDMGIGSQPPLLLAVIMRKQKSIQKLLDLGANPGIQYLNKPLILYIIKKWDLKLARAFLDKQLNLTENEKHEIIDFIMSGALSKINDDALFVLKKLGYDIKTNFDSADLTKNKWFLLLTKQPMRFNHGTPIEYSGVTPSKGLVTLFLKNGANPGQTFRLTNETTMTPIMLVLDNYIARPYHRETDIINLLKTLINAGASVNQTARPLQYGIEESPLSYALKYDEVGSMIDFLTKNGASIDIAVDLFLKNGGLPIKTIKQPTRYGTLSLLLWAVENKNPRAVQLLINSGVKISKEEALKFAISKGYGEIINILMEN